MSQLEKALDRIKLCPKDYTYDEASALLTRLGFSEDNKGRTSGSRVRFFRTTDKKVIMLHKPHPQAVKDLKQFLEDIGVI